MVIDTWMWVVAIVAAFFLGTNFGWNARQHALNLARVRIMKDLEELFAYVRELEGKLHGTATLPEKNVFNQLKPTDPA
jgi:hypothetical protein